jgi:hypothetical protein
MNQRWINCKGGWMTIMIEKVIMVVQKISYLGHYVEAKELQKVNRVWTLLVIPLHVSVMRWHFELWICQIIRKKGAQWIIKIFKLNTKKS